MIRLHAWRGACVGLAIAAAVSTLRADWQDDASALEAAPMRHSLLLEVVSTNSLELVLPGGVVGGRWGGLAAVDIPLGVISPQDDPVPLDASALGDWSGSRLIADFENAVRITVYASQLSPGIAIETTSDRIRLFGGAYYHLGTAAKPAAGPIRGSSPLPITPLQYAVPSGEGLDARSLPEASGAEEELDELLEEGPPWILVWWGAWSHFARTDNPIGVRCPFRYGYMSDCPLLLVFDSNPKTIRAAAEGGMDFVFEQPGRRMTLLPVMGALPLKRETTEKWAEGFPEELAPRLRRLAAMARRYPVSVRESFRYDTAKDEAVFTEKVTFLDVGQAGEPFVPLPPPAALAMQRGFPLAIASGRSEDFEIPTLFGPLSGAGGSDTLVWSVKGLGRYVRASRAASGGTAAPDALQAELEARVAQMIEAGPLRPWVFMNYLPSRDIKGQYYWGEPGDVLALLAEIHDAVGPATQAALLAYMTDLYAAYPPETVAVMPDDKGAPRAWFDFGPCKLSESLVKEWDACPSLFALYGLDRYLSLAKRKQTPESWKATRRVIDESFQESCWATLCSLKEGTYVGVVVNANRAFAGAVGAIRLARAAVDPEAEQQGWWLLARAAVLRCFAGTYAAWRYDAALAVPPADKEWYWKEMAYWGDTYILTKDWSRPADDLRHVIGIGPGGVELREWAPAHRTLGRGLGVPRHFPVYFGMVPESARFLRDHLGVESNTLLRRIERHHPFWHASFSEAIMGANEVNMMNPSDGYQLFMGLAQIAGEKPERLDRLIDVPWIEKGDLFYMNKLAETIKAYRGVEWRE